MRTALSAESAVAGTPSWLPSVHLVCRPMVSALAEVWGRAARLGWAGRRVGAWLPCDSLPDPKILCASFVLPGSLRGKGLRDLHEAEKNGDRLNLRPLRAPAGGVQQHSGGGQDDREQARG